MKVLHEVKNPLLHRREVVIMYGHAHNPGYAHTQKVVAEHFGVGEEVVVVKQLTNAYGSSDFKVDAFVYDSADAKQKFEPRPKKAKAGAAA